MKEYTRDQVRNIAVVGHGNSGKTSLVDACFYNTGAAKRIGKVDDGTSASDFDAEEIRRKMSISTTLVACEWQGYKINLLDTPGYPDFTAEVRSAMYAADSALVVLCAPAGIEVETEKAWRYAEKIRLPRAVFVNKMDREHADFYTSVEQLKVKFGQGFVPIQIPVGKADTFQGVADLLAMHIRFVTNDSTLVESEIPEFLREEVEAARQKLIEAVAEFNNELLDKYLEGIEIAEDEVAEALIEGIQAAKIFPVLCGSSLKNIGAKKLLNAMVEYMPAPLAEYAVGTDPNTEELLEREAQGPFSALVFKTTADPFVGKLSYIKVISGSLKNDALVYNSAREKTEKMTGIFTLQGKRQEALKEACAGDIVVAAKLQYAQTGDTLCDPNAKISYEFAAFPKPMFTMSIAGKNKGDEDKIGSVLQRLLEEDPTLEMCKHPETKQTLLSGIGEMHLDIVLEKVKRKFGVEIVLSEPKVPYRETIRAKSKVEGKHKKQSGGHGQYGHVWLQIEPLPAGSGVEFAESIFGGAVPRQYVPAVEKGVRETLTGGILAGYPVVDIKVNLCDGSYHTVDSSEMAFKTASAIAVRKGVMEAKPVLLEPIYDLEIIVPEYYMGDVVGNLNARRGRILGMDSAEKDMGTIKAQAPLSELFRYATDLRSLSQGRGVFNMEFSHYEEAPKRVADAVIQNQGK